MQATEALQLILEAANKRALVAPTVEERDRLAEAYQLCNSFQNTAVPLARFRCFVTIEEVDKKSKLGVGDFVVTATSIPGIKNGLVGLSMEKVSVYIQLWEHVEGGKFDMHCGYQGMTKCLAYRNWLADIDRFEVERVASS